MLQCLRVPGGLAGVRVIKSNMVRTVYRAETAGMRFILKRYHSGGLGNAIKYMVLPSRAAAEWNAMQRIDALHLPTSKPIVFGEKRRCGLLIDSFFAAAFIDDSLPFGPCTLKLQRKGLWNSTIKNVLFDKLARLTAGLHEASVFHADYHLGNVLVAGFGSDDPDLFVIDLHNVRFPARLSRRSILLNLARVAESLRQLGEGEVRAFLEKYLALRPGFAASADNLEEEVARRVASLDRRSLRSRTRRCLVKSSNFTPARAGGFKMNLRRTCSPADVLEAIRIHDSVPMTGDDRLIPPSNKNKVTTVEISTESGPVKVCVKEYRRRSLLRRFLPVLSEGRRSWIAGLGLEVRGIATPETVAWVRGRGRELVLTRHVAGAEKLHAFASRACDSLPPEARAAFARGLAADAARFVRKIHDRGIRHRDLCEQNILVLETGGRRFLFLTDLDTVTFRRGVGRSRIAKNLIQLGHMPADVDLLVKARFLKHYLGPSCPDAVRLDLFRRVDEGVLARMAAKRRRFLRRGEPDPHPVPSAFKKSW